MSGRAPTLAFLGGARTVTGSKYLVSTADATVLVDCGLYQGGRELRERNWDDAAVPIERLDAVVLTHAHVDHTGYLPRLVANGFRGPVYATADTCALARIVLPDCGHLQEEEAEYANRKGISRHSPALPLYTEQDAVRSTELLQATPFLTDIEIAPGVSLRFSRAGHILGSAGVHVALGDASAMFSGDLGRPWHPLLVPPDPPQAADLLIVESTYGDRRHERSNSETSASDDAAAQRLGDVVRSTVERGGSVLIPAFAVDRTEIVLYHLAQLVAQGAIRADLPIFVDSPMALRALGVYRRAFEHGAADLQPRWNRGSDPFALAGLREVETVEESKALNHPAEPCVIISASGMASGGRVVHHLAHLAPDARNTIVLVGYQVIGTRGRQLVDGVDELKMLGRYVRVRAQVVNLGSFSVHADAHELLDWVASAEREPDTVYVVHGEPTPAETLAAAIRQRLDWTAVVPRREEIVRVDAPR